MIALKQVDYFKELLDNTEFFEEVQYHMSEEYIEAGTEIISSGEIIKSIIFIVEGDISLTVFDSQGNEITLENLNQGDVIGQYSVLFNEEIMFSVKALTNARILTLSEEFFSKNKEYIDGIEDAIIEAEDFVDKYGIPICDFKPFVLCDTKFGKIRRALNRAKRLINCDILDKAQHFMSEKVLNSVRKDVKEKKTSKSRRGSIAPRTVLQDIRFKRRESKMSQK